VIVRDWTLPLDEEDRATLAQVHQRFAGCCRILAESGGDPDSAAKAVAEHLGPVSTLCLPLAAQTVWADRVARPLKSDPTKPLTPRAIGAIRASPSRRIADLASALAEIESILVDTENDALHEAIYTEISRTYS
jgi:hypothetical protein